MASSRWSVFGTLSKMLVIHGRSFQIQVMSYPIRIDMFKLVPIKQHNKDWSN